MPSGDGEPAVFEQFAVCFDNFTDQSAQISRALKIKDFADNPNLVLKQPICFECFDEILKKLGDRVSAEEAERDMYRQELVSIEQEMAGL